MKKRLFIIVILLLVCVLLSAQEKRAMTVEDLWKLDRVSSGSLSPDGKWLAFTITKYDMEENKGETHIWLVSSDGKTTRQLTNSATGESSPVWHPDSKTLAFSAKRDDDKSSQIYTINIYGGEAKRLTNFVTGASGFKWDNQGNYIYFISSVYPDAVDEAENEKRIEAAKNDKVKAHVVDQPLFRYWNHWVDDGRLPMLFSLELKSGKITNLFKDKDYAFDVTGAGSSSYDISPDGSEICFVFDSARSPGLDANNDLYLLNLKNGEIQNITAANKAEDSSPVFSPDGKYIVYSSTKTPDVPEYSRLTLFDRSSGSSRVLTEDFEYSPSGKVWSNSGDKIYFAAGVEGRSPLFCFDLKSEKVNKLFDGHSMDSIQVAPDGNRIYFSREAFDLPPTLFAANLDGTNEIQLTRFNDQLLSEILWHKSQSIKFKGAGGDEVQMFLLTPHDFDKNKKYPLFVQLHGGPHGVSSDGFHPRWNSQLFAAPGYVEAIVNFHGSSTFGQKFYDSIAGAEADKPYADTMAAVEYLVSQGFIDETKIAAGGGSYGGYLTNWIATQTDKFAALITHAGGFNHHGMFASDTPRFRERRWGGFPWKNQAATDRQSPNRFADNIKTPMLILHGELDYRVVVTQGIELYNTLQIKGIPARMVYFPDEGHWITKPQNARLWWNEVHAWLAKYIGNR